MYYLGERIFFGGDRKIFRKKLGALEIFNLFCCFFWGGGRRVKFSLDPSNSVALHHKFIYHLPEIFNTKNANRT